MDRLLARKLKHNLGVVGFRAAHTGGIISKDSMPLKEKCFMWIVHEPQSILLFGVKAQV